MKRRELEEFVRNMYFWLGEEAETLKPMTKEGFQKKIEEYEARINEAE